MRASRRSRSAVGLLAVACLVAVAGCGSEGADRQLSPPTAEATDVADPTAEPEPTPTSGDDADVTAPQTADAAGAAGVEVSAPFDHLAENDGYLPAQWLVPWQDGFLAVSVRPPEQPLPDSLPPEIAELFPPEVVALFPDGLPPTQAEAVEILEEAGLLQEVMDVIYEYPEAMEALQAAQSRDTVLAAAWTLDGEDWRPIDLAVPAGMGWINQVAVAGDRLTLAGALQPDDDAGAWKASVASTTDLDTWETASFWVSAPPDLPENGSVWVSPIAVAADDERWVVRIMVDAMAEAISGIPYSEPRPELWSGTWGGVPALVTREATSWTLVPTSEGFLDLGEGVWFSRDGQTWTDGATLGPNVTVHSASPLGDGVLAIAGTAYGDSSIFLVDATGQLVDEIEFPELGDDYFAWGGMSGPALIAESSTSIPSVTSIVVEHDGFELTQEFGDVLAYRLVELDTGDVVVEESVDLRTTPIGDDGPYEHLVEDQSGITVSDPDTGDPLVEIPQAALGRAWAVAQREAEENADPTRPSRWLLATTDGETWLVEHLDEGVHDEWGPPMLVAVNGTTVLTGTLGWEPGADIWQRYTIAG